MSARQHRDAILTNLRADPQLAESVFTPDKVPANPPERYAVVYTPTPYRTSDRLSGAQVRETTTHTIHSVGDSEDKALWIEERIGARLLDFVPVISGRICGRVSFGSALAVTRDASTSNPDLYYGVSEVTLTSDPA